MKELTQEQYQTMLAQGMTPERIQAAAQRNGYKLPSGKDFLTKATEVVNKIFPGGKVGELAGTYAGYGLTKASEATGLPIAPGGENLFHKAQPGESKQYDLSTPTALQVAGDIAQGALTVAAPAVGTGEAVLGRIAANTALGVGLAGSGAISQGKSAEDVAKSAALGGVTGGVASGVGEAIPALLNSMPKWLANVALPKLEGKNLDYALNNISIGPAKTIAAKSQKALNSYETSIQSILNHPEHLDSIGGSNVILANAKEAFPNADYTVDKFVKNARKLAPSVSKLIDKFEKGTANTAEINLIRKELDKATETVYTRMNRPPESKELGKALADAMRTYVQEIAPETAPIFSNYSKEVALKKAIDAAIKKGKNTFSLNNILSDLGAGGIGFAGAGPAGALGAVAAKRVATAPGVRLSAAKATSNVADVANAVAPVAETAFQATKAPLLNQLGQ